MDIYHFITCNPIFILFQSIGIFCLSISVHSGTDGHGFVSIPTKFQLDLILGRCKRSIILYNINPNRTAARPGGAEPPRWGKRPNFRLLVVTQFLVLLKKFLWKASSWRIFVEKFNTLKFASLPTHCFEALLHFYEIFEVFLPFLVSFSFIKTQKKDFSQHGVQKEDFSCHKNTFPQPIRWDPKDFLWGKMGKRHLWNRLPRHLGSSRVTHLQKGGQRPWRLLFIRPRR